MNETIPELILDPRLISLLRACEKYCHAECCGLAAFTITPLHVASHLSICDGEISASVIDEHHQILDKCVEQVADLKADREGYLCHCETLNETLTQESFDEFIQEIRDAINLSPKMVSYSDQLLRE